jgi:hypothetical protein
LNRDLSHLHDTLARVWRRDSAAAAPGAPGSVRLRYAFGGVAALMSSLTVHAVAHLRNRLVSPAGVDRLARALFTLQQNLIALGLVDATAEDAVANAAASEGIAAALDNAIAAGASDSGDTGASGVARIRRRLAGLRSEAVAAAEISDRSFDRARTYVELLNLSPPDLDDFEQANRALFTRDEYAALRTIKNTHHDRATRDLYL